MSLVAVEMPTDLGSLAAQINDQCEKAEQAVTEALTYAYTAGAALLTAQELVPPGQWLRWLEANVTTVSVTTAQRFMKFAHYRAELDAAGVSSITEAVRMTQLDFTRPRPNKAVWASKKTDDAVRRIKECRAAGMTWTAIAEEMGLNHITVRCWADPVYDAKRRAAEAASTTARKQRRQDQLRVERQMERDALARERKGKPANAYSLIRRCLAELDAAIGEVEEAPSRTALREAMKHCHRA